MALGSGFLTDGKKTGKIQKNMTERTSPKLPVNTEISLYKRFRFFEYGGSMIVRLQEVISKSTLMNETRDADAAESEAKDEVSYYANEHVVVSGYPKDWTGTGFNEIRSATI